MNGSSSSEGKALGRWAVLCLITRVRFPNVPKTKISFFLLFLPQVLFDSIISYCAECVQPTLISVWEEFRLLSPSWSDHPKTQQGFVRGCEFWCWRQVLAFGPYLRSLSLVCLLLCCLVCLPLVQGSKPIGGEHFFISLFESHRKCQLAKRCVFLFHFDRIDHDNALNPVIPFVLSWILLCLQFVLLAGETLLVRQEFTARSAPGRKFFPTFVFSSSQVWIYGSPIRTVNIPVNMPVNWSP